MSCSTTGVWPFIAAKMTAVLLPRSQLPLLNSVKPWQSAQRPYPALFWTSRAAPAAMSCSTTSVWPCIAAEMSAVILPRSRLPLLHSEAITVGSRAVPFVVLDIESGAGGDELLDHERVAFQRGIDERSAPAEKSAGRFG